MSGKLPALTGAEDEPRGEPALDRVAGASCAREARGTWTEREKGALQAGRESPVARSQGLRRENVAGNVTFLKWQTM